MTMTISYKSLYPYFQIFFRDLFLVGCMALIGLGVFASFTFSPFMAFQLFPELGPLSLPAIPFSIVIFPAFGIFVFLKKCNEKALPSALLLLTAYSSWELVINQGIISEPYTLLTGHTPLPNPLIFVSWMAVTSITIYYFTKYQKVKIRLPLWISAISFLYFTMMPFQYAGAPVSAINPYYHAQTSFPPIEIISASVMVSEIIWLAQIWFSVEVTDQ